MYFVCFIYIYITFVVIVRYVFLMWVVSGMCCEKHLDFLCFETTLTTTWLDSTGGANVMLINFFFLHFNVILIFLLKFDISEKEKKHHIVNTITIYLQQYLCEGNESNRKNRNHNAAQTCTNNLCQTVQISVWSALLKNPQPKTSAA